MNLKSLFVTAYIVAGMGGTVFSIVQMLEAGWISPWLGSLIACGAPALFFTRLILAPIARTSNNLPVVLAAGVVGTIVSIALAGAALVPATVLSVVVGVIGTLIYVYWYSRFGSTSASGLVIGAPVPEFSLLEGGQEVSSQALRSKAAVWIFYRGNWCPLCMAQIKEVAAQYREIAKRGVEVRLISPQPEQNTVSLSKKFDAPMRFMTDPENAAARKLGILIEGGLPSGFQALGYDSDVPRPTVFITDGSGKLIYCDLTDNYRVRPEPADFIGVLDQHGFA